ncbi:hypothetical protein COB64_04280 [Candidatus Wolfebacteria bacterium]|nr:MAG: hypothetical protein COB64_04280 [Candidatus Wolfebacteria bacterium]
MELALIEISEARTYLNYVDSRSVNSWAQKNEVEVFTQGKCKFMLRDQFFAAYNLPIFRSLIKKFGKVQGTLLFDKYFKK